MTTEPDKETRFTGLPISPGVVVAQVCLFQQNRHTGVRANGLPGKGFDRERARLDRAKTGVIERLEDLRETVARRLGPAEAGILVAQRMMIEDPALNEQMDRALTDGCNAETAVVRTLDSYESQLLELDDAYLRERAGDLGELKHRLLDVLCDTRPSFQCTADAECRRGQDRIVITDELTPAAVLEIETDRLLGFVAERGGATSHAGILARALGIPAVSGIPNIHNLVACGTEVFLDGNTGEVAIRPNRATKARAAGAGAAAPLSLHHTGGRFL